MSILTASTFAFIIALLSSFFKCTVLKMISKQTLFFILSGNLLLNERTLNSLTMLNDNTSTCFQSFADLTAVLGDRGV